jgi:5-methylthioadenosine/S-adenosylhomocysteine deaminase
MEREIGSLEPGKRADLITVSLSEANALPMYNVYSQLVYALKAWDVQDVVVNGKVVVRQRRPLTLNRDEILAKAAEYGASVTRSLKSK